VDYKNAIKWFRSAAEDGDLDAVAYLVMIYSKGIGVEPSMLKATKWFLKGSSDILMEVWGVLKEELQKEWDKL
jgi:TPR repeat protein